MHLSHEIQQKCYIFRIYHSWPVPVPVFMRFPNALEKTKQTRIRTKIKMLKWTIHEKGKKSKPELHNNTIAV